MVSVTGASELDRELNFSRIVQPDSWHSLSFENATLVTGVCLGRQMWELLRLLLTDWLAVSLEWCWPSLVALHFRPGGLGVGCALIKASSNLISVTSQPSTAGAVYGRGSGTPVVL